MATQVILLVIVFVSSVVGTMFGSQPWVKEYVIALAAASTIAALCKAFDDSRNTDFIKGALAAELASSKPTPSFRRELVRNMNRVAEAKGLRVCNQIVQEEGTLFTLVTQHTDAEAGAVRFDLDSLGQAYVKFVSKKSMDSLLRKTMYTIPSTKDENSMSNILEELAFVGKTAIVQAVPNLSKAQFISHLQYDPPNVSLDAILGSNIMRMSLDKDFVAQIISLPPYARNWKAYEVFQRQVKLTSLT